MIRTITAFAGLATATLTTVATPVPSMAAVASTTTAPNRMCLDVGNTRTNGDHVWQCQSPGFGNQNLVIQDGQIIVKDTIGTSQPMCLDVGNTRTNGDRVKIWQCQAPGFGNQDLVIQDGQIVVKDTI